MPSGFTLLELLVVIAVLASVASLSAYESIDSFQHTLEHARIEQDIDAAQAARGNVLRGIIRDTP
jgi:prepilin-type N-terminal cleavage/methylation domain-containing protein